MQRGGHGPHEKGARFERKICQRLSQWVSDFKRSDIFWRSAASGAKARVSRKKGEKAKFAGQWGDISSVVSEGNFLTEVFIIECKHYNDIGFHATFYDKKTPIKRYWNDLREIAFDAKKYPIIIIKENRRQEIIGFDRFGKKVLAGFGLKPFVIFPTMDLHLYSFRDLISDIEFKDFAKRVNKKRSTM